jgi:restriction endonuclease S subunit
MTTQSLKPGWKIMKFGDFVGCVRKQGQPTEEDSRSYVGLEHLDSGSLHVKRWGSDADLKGQKLRMKKGDLLFAKRNAYLRRVAISPHDGFFSAHGMVLRPTGKHILPEFLPFFLQSDMFMERAIEISVGSLSPTINWKTLRVQEFPLPPLHEQKRIAEILWAADEAVEKHNDAEKTLFDALNAHLDDFFPPKIRSLLVEPGEMRLGDLCRESISYGIVQAGEHVPDGVPYIRVSDMTTGELTTEGMLRTSPEIAARFKRSTVQAGDIVYALRGEVGLVRVVPPSLEGANLTQGTARIAPVEGVNRDYLLWALRSKRSRRQFDILAKGSTFREITLADLRKVLILERADEQETIATVLNRLQKAIEHVQNHLKIATSARSTLVNVLTTSSGATHV